MNHPQDFHQVRQVVVNRQQAGQRIDNFLLGQLAGVPRSVVYRILRTGQVRVNKGRIKPAHRLLEGDIVRIPPVTQKAADERRVPQALIDQLAQCIIASDEQLIVLDKPVGVAVHGGSGIAFGVVDAMRALHDVKDINLVHRLDRNTSGLLVLARGRPATVAFQASLRQGRVKKIYQALLLGQLAEPLTIDAPLRKIDTDAVQSVRVDSTGKPAHSVFTPLLSSAAHTLASVQIETGRTHQIRVHAAHAGLPVVGDSRYGDWAGNRRAAGLGHKRMFLHASELEFPDPSTGAVRCYQTPNPGFDQVLEQLRG